MSRLIALRLPDDLAARLDTRCSIRGQSKTDVLIEAIQRGWEEAAIKPIQARPAIKPIDIPGVFMGSQLGIPLVGEAELVERPMCSYTEYDGQTGETYRCALTAHGPKVKHVRGTKV